MQEYEKYGNNCMQIARVLSTQTPAQIKKACWMFLQTKFENKFCSSETKFLSLNEKAQVLVTNATEQQNYQQSLSPESKV
jgi:hypothetical protein